MSTSISARRSVATHAARSLPSRAESPSPSPTLIAADATMLTLITNGEVDELARDHLIDVSDVPE